MKPSHSCILRTSSISTSSPCRGHSRASSASVIVNSEFRCCVNIRVGSDTCSDCCDVVFLALRILTSSAALAIVEQMSCLKTWCVSIAYLASNEYKEADWLRESESRMCVEGERHDTGGRMTKLSAGGESMTHRRSRHTLTLSKYTLFCFLFA
jgi:hypothetical protein